MKIAIACLMMLAGLPVAAQITTGSLTGNVEDPSGLGVPQASITLTHAATGRARHTTSDATGSFALNGLEAGEYRLAISKAGFKQSEKDGLVLPAGMRLPAGRFVLQVGGVSETVTVNAERDDIVQTQSSERGDVITSSQVENLQILGRNAPSLIQLLPGVVMTNDPDALDRNTTFSALGGRNTTNGLSVDGVPSTDVTNGFDLKLGVSMDSVAEVRIFMSNYQAEYGRVSGASIQVVTKSGTRNFHGLASYFKRHEEFNANNFFNNRLRVPKSRYRYNTWNYSLGGPVFIPGLFNRDRDRMFFYWSQEFWPRKQSTLGSVTVPTLAERAGDFSESIDQNNRAIPIQDPYDAKRPFPGNRIPASRLDPSGVALLKMFPAPNFTDRTVSLGAYNLVFPSELDTPKRTSSLKLDYNFDANNLLFGTLTLYREQSKGYLTVPGWSETWEQYKRIFEARNKGLSLRYTRIISPRVSNEFSFAWFDNPETEYSPPDELKRIQRDPVGFRAGQLYSGNNPLNIVPSATFGGVVNAASLNNNGRFPIDDPYHLFSWTDKLTVVLGSHTLKGGLNLERFWRGIGWNSAQFGSLAFTNNATNPLNTNYAYSNAALGVYYTYTESSAVPYHNSRGGRAEWFVQDNWRVTRRLTLDYGMRLYWLIPTYDRDNKVATFVPSRFDPSKQVRLIWPGFDSQGVRVGVDRATGQTYSATLIGGMVPNSGNPANGMVVAANDPDYPRALYRNRGWQYGPRFGFAYDPFGKNRTSVRAGVGVFYNPPVTYTWAPFTNQSPLVLNPVVYYGTLEGIKSASGLLFPGSILALDPSGKVATVTNYSFSIQQSIGWGTVVDVGYVGALGRHMLWRRDLNAIPFGTNFLASSKDPTNSAATLSALLLYPRPGYTNIYAIEPASNSNYHSLQVSANRRFARGFQYGFAWTWSKALNYSDSDSGVVSSLVPVRVWNYGLSNIDRTHTVKINWQYTPPAVRGGGAVAKAVVNGWQFSGITTFQSGAPLAVSYSLVTGKDITGSPTDGARVVVTGNPVLPKSERTFGRNLRTEVFQVPAVGTVGNAARTVIRGPGINNWDVSVFRNFPVHEQMRLQFRCELYNAINHTQFSALDTAARFDNAGAQVSGSFGSFTAARNPRQIQMALRFYF
jgi:hypothetical protein